MVALDCGAGVDGRTRAASAWGWSGYSDPIMVLTAGGGGASEVRKSVDASADAASTTKYVSRAPACLPTADRPEVVMLLPLARLYAWDPVIARGFG